jgi:hypothetical protein
LGNVYEIDSVGIARVISLLGRVEGVLIFASDQKHQYLESKTRADVTQHMQEMQVVMADMPMPVTLVACKRLNDKAANDDSFTYEDLSTALSDIVSRLRDEMSSVEMIGIEAEKVKYYSPSEPLFGAAVAAKFPSLAYEISEAAKWLALDRNTASVFHSVRCLEGGIRAMARCLGIGDPTRGSERSWIKVLKAIKEKMDERWPPSMVRGSGDDQLFDNAYAALAGMQNPWRNSTMHLDQVYTSEEARHVFDIVGGFMRKLSSRMDENGLPLAYLGIGPPNGQ